MGSVPTNSVLYRICLVAVFLCLFCLISVAQKPQDQDFPAELPADDGFGRTRSGLLSEDLKAGAGVFKFKPAYKLKRKIVRPKHVQARADARKPGGSPPKPKYDLPSDTKSVEKWETLGVTLWRVVKGAPSTGDNEGTARLLIQQTGEHYTPIRANADTVFALGDEVRIAVESPRQGYLYIVDREMLADDKLGDPYQVFPTMAARGGDNTLRPGALIEVPGQGDMPFKLSSDTPGYRGEMLTIIVSPVPLKELGVPRAITRISSDLVNEMERLYLYDVGEYYQEGSAGKAYTTAEKEAGSGNTRQLVQGDPQPQTKYRVKVRPKEPMVINVSLNVK